MKSLTFLEVKVSSLGNKFELKKILNKFPITQSDQLNTVINF